MDTRETEFDVEDSRIYIGRDNADAPVEIDFCVGPTNPFSAAIMEAGFGARQISFKLDPAVAEDLYKALGRILGR